MTKDEFVMRIKRTAAAFGSDGPGSGDHTDEEWRAIWTGWQHSLAKTASDTKRSKKARDEAESMRKRAEDAGIALVIQEEVVQHYDQEMAHWRGRAEAAEAKLQGGG